MNPAMLGILIGGLGLFMLGMRLMTDGLKYAAGKSLRDILAASTATPWRGIVSGAFLTSLVQSSSAVTVATIGFVNAGLMDLGHSVALVYGSNIGTTMTGWLIALVGFKVNIKIFALPIIGLGMLLRVVRHESRRGALGDVLTGFGIFFLGVDILNSTFAGLGETIDISALAGSGFSAMLLFVGLGFLLTTLMQSSSAAIAIILTAAASNIILFQDAAAVVIGANIGTTSTAAFAVIGATPNAKRLAAAHVIFNVITGIIALLLLPVLLLFIDGAQTFFDLENSVATSLALFHTTFNLLGVAILFPLTGRLVSFLNRRFRTAEEDESRPQYLDHTVVATPILALHALEMELKRIGKIARRMAYGAISSESGPGPQLVIEKNIIERLLVAVADFGNQMQRGNLPAELDNQLPNALRVSGYYNDIAELAVELADIQKILHQEGGQQLSVTDRMSAFRKNTVALMEMTDIELPDYSSSVNKQELDKLKDEYRELKASLLRSASRGEFTVRYLVNYLELIARLRHMAEQAEKAGRYLDALHLTEEELKASDSRVEGVNPPSDPER